MVAVAIFLAITPMSMALFGCTQQNEITKEKYIEQLIRDRSDKDLEFRASLASPLLPEDRKKFNGLNYFPVEFGMRVEARFEMIHNLESIIIQTSTGEERDYVKTGQLHFRIDNKSYTLSAFREKASLRNEGRLTLFIPFTDQTTGQESYEGGRYLNLQLPDSGMAIIDFNLAYNPYCAYNHTYSCPLPPRENQLPIKITAGEKKFTKPPTLPRKLSRQSRPPQTPNFCLLQ
ncbi:MAG: hypothetical protein A2521_04485 [Deltaproteobacteria bacterium RIFOXYD12_FULL_57_12]|nr:MAG: hypothetical protein A2521_04485 [Deltaproteobacteria bacterium RIFOXYD12_FULL_57_12]